MHPLNPEEWTADLTPTTIQNPLAHDFKHIYLTDDNSRTELSLPALDVVTLPKWLAERVIVHLTDAMINTRGLGFLTPEERLRLEEEIRI